MTRQDEFIIAIENNDSNKIKKLLKDTKGTSINAGCDLLAVSCFFGHIEIIKVLLKDKRVKVNSNQNIALRLSVENCYYKITELILKSKYIEPSKDNNIVLREIYDKIKKGIEFTPNNQNIQSSEISFDKSFSLLCNDKRVRSTLQKDIPELYSKIIKKEMFYKINNF